MKYLNTFESFVFETSNSLNEAFFKAKDYNKTLITYGIDTKANEIYIVKVAPVIKAGFPTTENIPDKRFHDMMGFMLQDNWMKQYDKLPNPGDILPAPKKDKVVESKLNERLSSSDQKKLMQFADQVSSEIMGEYADDFDRRSSGLDAEQYTPDAILEYLLDHIDMNGMTVDELIDEWNWREMGFELGLA